jgi:hypothetical protein
MTYIVGGKFENNPFLMIDCKGVDEEGKALYSDKVVKLSSTEEDVYFCQMGHTGTKFLFQIFDEILTFEGKKFNVFDIQEIIKVFDKLSIIVQETDIDTIHYGENDLFFISNDKITKYVIQFDMLNKKFHRIYEVNVKNNECMSSNSPLIRDVVLNDINLNEFCKDVIEKEKNGIFDELKDRYTFIQSDGEKMIYHSPHKSRNDIVNMYLGLGFDKL